MTSGRSRIPRQIAEAALSAEGLVEEAGVMADELIEDRWGAGLPSIWTVYDRTGFQDEVTEHRVNAGKLPTSGDLASWLVEECTEMIMEAAKEEGEERKAEAYISWYEAMYGVRYEG